MCLAYQSEIQSQFNDAFLERMESYGDDFDDSVCDSFMETSGIYAERAVKSGACKSADDYYSMYISRDYKYSSEFVEKVKEPYIKSGASSLVNQRDVKNAFDLERFGSTIGRQENGIFVTSCSEDSALIYDTNGELKSSSNIEEIKGLGAGKFDEGVYQYEYDSEFVRSCDSKGLVRVVNGDNPGANSLNILGCQTWAGEEIGNSESELLMPSVDVKGYSSDDVFSSISEKGYFEIKDPIVLDQNGNRIQVTGKFKIKKLR